MTDPIKDLQDRGLLSIEKVDAQAELDKLSAEMLKDMNFIAVLLSPVHVVPVFDGQYVQHQDRPVLEFPQAKYLYPQKVYTGVN